MGQPPSNRDTGAPSGPLRSQNPPRHSLTSLLASEVDVAKKSLANNGENALLQNFPRKADWKVSPRSL